ncbi:RagB/SusD family nutrient uptake outer membrane protein [Chitinophaga sp. sic0106]|uniref:RagB/SusD family nutrient uptake outer membrane protein n=1 Tax=Chitinophaga sp. sic0106 TaxID=2854785 RepID=UPI001C43E8E4|nr:RagB/SusD family nutrient uptake outer membrane protein [Chitinophaga sp. sic0106]MBV7533660.1 RagB/SusD family nutrient uptake outer membrane protein [Chitinophaga sp. sic0106]
MKKILIAIAAAGLFMQACSNKLDVKPSDGLDVGDALVDVAGANTALNGVYDALQQTEYYGRNYWVMTEVNADNIYIAASNSNRFLSSFRHDYNTQDADVQDFWTVAYTGIMRADRILEAIDKVSGAEADKNVVKGEALFLRALMHFDLVNVFARPYAQGGGSQPGVPLKLKYVVDMPARATVKEVYDQVIADLTEAKTLLANVGVSTKYHASKYAASALLARVYLQKGDKVNAAAEATNVINAGYSLQPSAADFYNVPGSAEEIFTLVFTDAETTGSDNIGQMYLKPGYGDLRVSPDLSSKFDAKDSRLVYFGALDTEVTNRKFSGQTGKAGMTSPKLLRLSEMYLIRAEANSAANPDAAIADVNVIRENRNLDKLAGIAPAAVLDSVLAESRREFMFEGHRYFDLLRNGKGVDRNFCGSILAVTAPCSFTADAYNIVWPIPQTEKNTNPDIEQNQGYE